MSTNPKHLLLSGCGVLVTRPSTQADHLVHLLQTAGANVVRWPTLAIVAPEDPGPAIDLIDQLADFDVAVFISANAVDHGLELLKTQNQTLDHLKVVAIGAATAEQLRGHAIDPITPTLDATSEGVLALPVFWTPAINGKRVLIFRGVGGRETLGETLRARGAEVHYAEVYKRVKPKSDPKVFKAALDDGLVDAVVVTSAEGLQNLQSMLGPEVSDRLHRLALVVMSRRLADFARDLGFVGPVLTATTASDSGIVAALEHWCAELREAPTMINEATPADAPAGVAAAQEPAQETLLRATAPLMAEAEATLASISVPPDDAPEQPEAAAAGAAEAAGNLSPEAPGPGPAEAAREATPAVDNESMTAAAAAPAAPAEPVAAVPLPVPAPPRPNWPAWLALALGAAALGLQLFWTQSTYAPATAALKSQLEEVTGRVQGLSEKLPDSGKLKAEINERIDSADGTVKSLQQALEELREHGKSLGESHAALEQRIPQNADDWVLSEVDYLLLAADERLHNGFDVPSATAAVKTADDRLRSLSRPNLKPLREQLLKDQNAIAALPQIDISGYAMYLVDLLNRIEDLPLKGGDIVSKPKPELNTPAVAEEKARFNVPALAQAMWKDLTSLVRIEDTNLKDSATFEPEFRYFLQEHLRLEIAGARLDLVRRNPQDLKAAVAMIKNLLSRFYDSDAEAIKSINAKLDEIAGLDLQPKVPDLSTSLQMVRDYREHQRHPESKAAAAGEPQEPGKTADDAGGKAQ